MTYLRNGAAGVNGVAMDTLTYQYGRNSTGQLLHNRLRYVHDRVADNAYTEDIDSQTPLTLGQVQAERSDALNTDNYRYDAIGNLIKDEKEGIDEIEWTVYGKISKIIKGSTEIRYSYDATGNRISKEVDPAVGATKKTYYVRDASGNVMSVYEEGGELNEGNLSQSEVHLYGSSRLGIFKRAIDMTGLIAVPEGVFGYERGHKFFELSNHLGNVLVSITDRKNGVAQSVDTTLVDYYLPDIASASDYYPFGMGMPGRKVESEKYRYGFNGKENDAETGLQDYGMRIYNPALGRFLSVDPLSPKYPFYAPYLFAGNKPLQCIDLDGAEDAIPYLQSQAFEQIETSMPGTKYVRGKKGDKLATTVPEKEKDGLDKFLESINPLKVGPPVYETHVAQAVNFAASVGTFAYDYEKSLNGEYKIASQFTTGSVYVTVIGYSKVGTKIIENLRACHGLGNLTDAEIADYISSTKIIFDPGKDHSFLFWKLESDIPQVYPIYLRVGPITIPLAPPMPIIVPLQGPEVGQINTPEETVFVNTDVIAEELAKTLAPNILQMAHKKEQSQSSGATTKGGAKATRHQKGETHGSLSSKKGNKPNPNKRKGAEKRGGKKN